MDEDKLKSTESIENQPIEPVEADEIQEDIDENIDQEDIKETVPLATYLEIKSELKKLKSKVSDFEVSRQDEELVNKRKSLVTKYQNRGYDDDQANDLADDQMEIYTELANIRKTKVNSFIDEEIAELSQESVFSDIKNYTDVIKKKINQAKKAGFDLSVKEAYLNTVGIETKLKELSIHNSLKERKTGTISNDNVPTSNTGKPKEKFPLDRHDAKALAELQKAQPRANWTKEKYYNMMKRD